MALKIKSISRFHELRGLPKPQHPLISVVHVANVKNVMQEAPDTLMLDFYMIALKKIKSAGKLKYGQQEYDFNEGLMSFMAPNQVFGISGDHNDEIIQSGYVVFIHPDFLWNTPLAATIKQYEFFHYSVHEALFLSEKEEVIISDIIKSIEQEYQSNIDSFSQEIIISRLETLLAYANRFYHRQFITRKKTNHEILERLEQLLEEYFNDDNLITKGLPTVQYVSDALNISVSYLGRLLKTLTGQTTQQHVHDKLIDKAKEKLSTTTLSVTEIAYTLGFEHPQSFSKLFKAKTSQSPLAFRHSFN